MKINAFGRSSLAAMSAVCLAVPLATSDIAPRAVESVTASFAPALASLVLPGDHLAAVNYTAAAASDVRLAPTTPVVAVETLPAALPAEVVAPPSDEPFVVLRESGLEFVDPRSSAAPVATPLQPIDYINAITSAGWLVFAVPSLIVTIPIQILTGQRSQIIVSLNNIIAAVNQILTLVGRSIPPIPTPSAAQDAELLSAATGSDDAEARDAAPDVEGDSTAADPDTDTDADSDVTKDTKTEDTQTEDAGAGAGAGDDATTQDSDEAEPAAGKPSRAADVTETEDDTAATDGDTEPAPAEADSDTEGTTTRGDTDGGDDAGNDATKGATSSSATE